MAIAEHEPGKLYARNRGLLNMSHQQLHDFAATKRSNLPVKAKKPRKGAAKRATSNSYSESHSYDFRTAGKSKPGAAY